MNIKPERQKATHCGVLEFSAEEGRCYLPAWMMTQLGLDEGDAVRVDSAVLPKATYAKLKPQNLEFLQITNPRAMLEVELRKWACLTKDDRIRVVYNEQQLDFIVQDLKPKNAVCIVECDVNLDFDAPEGYEETARPGSSRGPNVMPVAPMPQAAPASVAKKLVPFASGGQRLDGKKSRHNSEVSTVDEITSTTEIPEAFCIPDYQPGQLNFVRCDYKCREVLLEEQREAAKAGPGFSVFEGSGATIRKPRY
ncbi:unnamed protein product, partial [Mesorhabditis spiculigera]